MFVASVLCSYFIRRRWLRILVVFLLGFAGFALLCAAAFGVAMGSGHGSHHGPSAEELSDTYMCTWPILVICALCVIEDDCHWRLPRQSRSQQSHRVGTLGEMSRAWPRQEVTPLLNQGRSHAHSIHSDRTEPNKSDAGNGSYGINGVIGASRSPSPDPKRSAKKMKFLPLLLALSCCASPRAVDCLANDANTDSSGWPKRLAPTDSHLRRLKEPSLKEAALKDTIDIRFIWVPTFNRPFAIRATGNLEKAVLKVVRMKGKGGYDWGEIETERSVDVSKEHWKALVALVAVDGAREPSQKASKKLQENFVEALSAFDGSTWYLEVRDSKSYSVEGVPNPIMEDPEFEKGLKEKSNLNLKPFLEVCMKLYALSGLDDKGNIQFHLLEAHESLGKILESLRTDPDYEYGNYWVEMQHLYRHINTAWNARDATEEQVSVCSQEDFDRWGCHPTDLEPL
jgi:hypothetical protein